MSRSGSSQARRRRSESGFTLAEALVVLVAGSILTLGLVRFYKDSYKTYSRSEQLAERDQNAHFIVNRFVEVLQQAGSSLPDSGWTTVRMSKDTLIVGINPRNAEQFVGQAASSSVALTVNDAKKFANTGNTLLNTTHVLIDYIDPSKPTVKRTIDVGANANGFVKGIKDNPSGLDSIRIDSSVTLKVGDRIYGYREDHYFLSNGSLVIRPNGQAANQMVLAENIDSLGVTLRDAAGNTATAWKDMRSASLVVRARTAKPDPKLPPPGYRKISLPMNIILRNRI